MNNKTISFTISEESYTIFKIITKVLKSDQSKILEEMINEFAKKVLAIRKHIE